jgi:tetratricopeptide (TPR) repeat protein
VAAAREAGARLAYEEAVRHWEYAAAATDARPADRTGVLLELADARRRAGQGQAAGQTYLRAAGLARAAKDPAALARAALGLHAIGTRTWWPPDQVVALLSEALGAFGSESGGEPLRLHVMASLSRALAWHGLDLPRAGTLAAEAVAAARAGADPTTLAACLLAQHHAVWGPDTAPDRLRIAAEVAELAERAADDEILLEARLLAATDRLELADPAFRAELDEYLRLAARSRQPRFRYAALVRRATLALLAGRLEEASQLIGQAEILGAECGEPGVRDVRYDQGWDLLTAQGRLGELAGTLPEMFPDPESAQARGARAQVLIAAGARDEAVEVVAPLLDRGPEVMPANHQRLISLAYAAEVTAALGIVPAAERIYLALEPFADRAVVSGVAVTFKGAVAHHLGLLAAALGRTAAAASHLEQAVATHDQLGAVTWSLRSQYELARLRLDQPGRREAAVSALAEVARKARTLGLAQLARDAEAAGFAAGQVPVTEGVFAHDGAMWTLSYGGVTVRMRDAKGLSDLAVLIAVPRRQVPAADLIAAAGAGQAALADLRMGADEVLDATARRQIRARLASLGEDIAEAESWNDPERAARARAERDALLRELAAAAAPGGPPRLLGDQSERARKAVTARIRDVIGRLERVHPALASHLRESVTTGIRCSYSPPTPVSWRL